MALLRNPAIRASACLLLLAAALPVSAEVTFNGFGQVVVGSTLTNKKLGTDPLIYDQSSSFPLEDSYAADPKFQPESLFALQAQAPLSNSVSATAQIVAHGTNDDDGADFTPKFTWAYFSYRINDEWAIKAGRQRIPFYKYSDYLEVGEAYPWIRTPLSVYQSPLVNYDGVSLTGSYSLGDWYLVPQISYGKYDGSLPFQGTLAHAELPRIAGGSFDATYNDWLSFRVAGYYVQNNSSTTATDPEINGLYQLYQGLATNSQFMGAMASLDASFPGNNYSEIPYNLYDAAELTKCSDPTLFADAAVEIDRNHFFFAAEDIYTNTPDGFFFKGTEYYLSAGYHFGKLMPVLLYGHSTHSVSNDQPVGLIPDQIPLPSQYSSLPAQEQQQVAAEIAALNQTVVNPLVPSPYGTLAYNLGQLHQGAIEIEKSQRQLYNFYEVGLRYDLTRNTSLKLDLTEFRSSQPDLSGSQLLSAAFVFTF